MTAIRNALFATAAAIGLTLAAVPAHAAVIKQFFSGNDCAGKTTCNATESGLSETAAGSPWIIKFDVQGDDPDDNPNNDITIAGVTFDMSINSGVFPSITGLEFNFVDQNGGNLSNATWTYTQGAGDPDIRFWVAKGGPNYNFFYEDGVDADSLADAVTSGSWTTPLNDRNGKLFGLSHVAFFDTGRNGGCTENCDPVPVPGVLGLLGAGLMGLGIAARRRRK